MFCSMGSPRFWESLIGVDNHKGLFNKMPMMFHVCVSNCNRAYRWTVLEPYLL